MGIIRYLMNSFHLTFTVLIYVCKRMKEDWEYMRFKPMFITIAAERSEEEHLDSLRVKRSSKRSGQSAYR